MTLSVSTQEITISNADGTTKFTSQDKLLYRANLYTGTLTLGGIGGKYRQAVLLRDANVGNRLNWTIDDSNIITIKVKPIYSEGNVGVELLGNTFDLSNGLVLDYVQTSGVYGISRHTMLSAYVKKYNRSDYTYSNSVYTEFWDIIEFNSDGLPVVEFTYYDLVGDGNSTFYSPYPPTYIGRYVDSINDVRTPAKIITFAYEISLFRWK